MEVERVSVERLPKLLEWLGQYLPDSWKLYHSVRDQVQGKWAGSTFYMLGSWPKILAVVEGLPDKETCPCYDHVITPSRKSCVFAPDPAHAETLLTWPGMFDFSRKLAFQGVSQDMARVLEKICGQQELNVLVIKCHLYCASPGTLEPSPIPDDLVVRRLDPDLDTEFAVSTWQYATKYGSSYIASLLKHYPSVGVFDSQGKCLGLEIGTEYGTIGMLYVIPEARGRGIAQIVISHLVQEYFKDGLTIGATVIVGNEASERTHDKSGMRKNGNLSWVIINETREDFQILVEAAQKEKQKMQEMNKMKK